MLKCTEWKFRSFIGHNVIFLFSPAHTLWFFFFFFYSVLLLLPVNLMYIYWSITLPKLCVLVRCTIRNFIFNLDAFSFYQSFSLHFFFSCFAPFFIVGLVQYFTKINNDLEFIILEVYSGDLSETYYLIFCMIK